MRRLHTGINVGAMCLMLSGLFLAVNGLGCGGSGAGVPDDDKFHAVQLGMSEAEVIEILGEPTRGTTHPQLPSLRLLEYGDKSRVVLDEGKVDTVILREKRLVEAELSEEAL